MQFGRDSDYTVVCVWLKRPIITAVCWRDWISCVCSLSLPFDDDSLCPAWSTSGTSSSKGSKSLTRDISSSGNFWFTDTSSRIECPVYELQHLIIEKKAKRKQQLIFPNKLWISVQKKKVVTTLGYIYRCSSRFFTSRSLIVKKGKIAIEN